jgi:flagellar basal body P-ring formation protein FlgA
MIPILLLAVLAGCLPVEGPKVTAADLARADVRFEGLAPGTAFGYSPAPGAHRIFRRAELARLAASQNLSLDGGADICVMRALEPLDPERLLDSMRAALAPLEARIELLETAKFQVPLGKLEFPASGLTRPSPGTPGAAVIWRGYVRYAGGSRYPVWARVKVSVAGTRIVAVEDLRPGRAIQAGQVREETGGGFPAGDPLASTLAEVVGRVPRRAIPAGSSIARTALALARDVERGDPVRVEASAGSASVELAGHAETGGAVGDTVVVRNPGSGKSFKARVLGKGSVAVGAAAGE